ncbi:uncharacterized protein Nmag_3426 [Natrialba magadii ATCC 43099]|uniref:ASCH domain-containing protein n=1 Tax=Natrialba magadii (strain ATCC 43099 / DSM 3394 / CCM 3739 / CIP 104546 / IAM 13178 / JCM 8861 / NBRC 102185 / NCIMB 2190 / MS3) TaxID=547559 RepID=D3STA9_NATMM|nr:hypothetical protein [Natrialba magadii]ADD06976.1 uncharacterized protein Nmag_3426 [Natrialba magadii ATCC 43099]ELY28881.1 hypothetical protein C500_13085 [Natrialba magadii ATCC 43099]
MSNAHVGPIVFADATARAQLENHGEVVTFRASERTTGDTWWRTSRTGPKEGDCRVEHIDAVDPTDTGALESYRKLSGFASVDDWQAAIRELNGEMDTAHLYRVVTDSTNGSD